MTSRGTLYGLGLGPGDPDLMTVRAHRLLRGATHVAYFRKAGRAGQARTIVEGHQGTITVESREDRLGGARFVIHLPLYAR